MQRVLVNKNSSHALAPALLHLIMAFRDLTRLYLELRERSTIGPVGHGNRDGHQKLLDEIDMTGDPGIEMSTTLPMSLPPIWVDIVEAIKSDMNTISKQCRFYCVYM